MRMLKRAAFIAAVALLVVTFGVSRPASAATTLTVRGSASCASGGVTGIWVESSGGGSGFAPRTLYGGGNMARFSLAISTNVPTTIALHVGCGGTPQAWGTTHYSPGKLVTGGTAVFVNAACNSPGSCSFFPRMTSPAGPATNPGASPTECTYRASDFWKLMTGSFPNWNGDAYQWAGRAGAVGWTVGNWPRPDSIVVWDRYAGGFGSLGHVGYVADVRNGSSGLEIKVYDRNADGAGGLRQGVWLPHGSGQRYILTSPRMGDLSYG